MCLVCLLSPQRSKSASEAQADAAKIQRVLNNFLESDKAAKWCMYEWFCADIDRPYFEFNDFQSCLDELTLHHVTHLTR